MDRREIAGAPERRALPLDAFELREGSGDTVTLTGYASVFDAPYDVYGGPSKGGWSEQVLRGAFDVTLREKPDVHLLINHEGMPLARTKSGTLQLASDDHGLHVDASLDRRDPDVQRLETKMRRGDMDEMSFAFRVPQGGDDWNDDQTQRSLTEVSIHKGDVSVVNFGANPATSSQLRSLFAALAEGDEEAADKVRAAVKELDSKAVSEARRLLSVELRQGIAPDARGLTVAEARQLVSL